ncbi:MAG: ABC transporter substrate-binding protein [Treponema sp.]|jgi:iron complex transport system substrate-binding protein|nr:ABC transporter substrate-binding protein [Treponema sp.]
MRKSVLPFVLIGVLFLPNACKKGPAEGAGTGNAVETSGSGIGSAVQTETGEPETGSTAEGPAAESNLNWTVTREEGAVYVADRLGNRIPLEHYRRMVVISPGAVETLYLIGGEEAIAGIASGREALWPEEKTVLLPSVGNTARPNLENIIALEPDLVIGNAMTAALIQDLAGRGYRGIVHQADSIEDIFNGTAILGRLSGRAEAAEKLNEEKRARLGELREELESRPLKLKGAFLYSAGPIMAFTEASLPGEILSALGVENIASGLDAAQPILSPEYILSRDPDFLFGAMAITKPADILAADSRIAETRAGREMNISIIPSSLFIRPSPRILERIPELYGTLRQYAAKNSDR